MKKKKDNSVVRLDWLKRKHDKALEDYNFYNGYRAGLECALMAIRDGRDILDYSIDDEQTSSDK